MLLPFFILRGLFFLITTNIIPADIYQQIITLVTKASALTIDGKDATGRQRREWVIEQLLRADSAVAVRTKAWAKSWGGNWVLDVVIKSIVAKNVAKAAKNQEK